MKELPPAQNMCFVTISYEMKEIPHQESQSMIYSREHEKKKKLKINLLFVVHSDDFVDFSFERRFFCTEFCIL